MNRKTVPLAVGLAAIAASIAMPVAASPTIRAKVAEGTLQISGGPFADRITLRQSALVRNQLEVDLGDDGTADLTFDLGTINAIVVDGNGGNDTIRIDDVNGAFTVSTPTLIDGGRGDDTLLGGGGNEIFVGGSGNDFADGNGGADTAFLGKGDDTFVWDPGDASDVVEGQAGSDTLVFNGSGGNEIMAASAAFGRVEFTRNLGGIVMDLDGIEAIDVRALGGTDAITVTDMTGTDVRRVDVDLAGALGGATADGAADTVTVAGTKGDDSIAANADGAAVDVNGLAAQVRITHADPASDSLVIDPVTGIDNVTIDPAVNALIQASVL